MVVGYLLFYGYSIALTDLLRREIKRRQWLDGSPGRALWRIGWAVFAIGTLQTFLVFSVTWVLTGKVTTESGGSSMLASTWMGVVGADAAWAVFYVAATGPRRFREKEVRLELALREAELRALEAQLNPHFLFNSLNSIRALVVENPPLAQDMLTRLANILRHNLHRDLMHTIPLSTELEAVGDYLALEGVRFEDRLRVSFAIDPAAAHMSIPPMLLQTLVENAVKHGIAPLPAGWRPDHTRHAAGGRHAGGSGEQRPTGGPQAGRYAGGTGQYARAPADSLRRPRPAGADQWQRRPRARHRPDTGSGMKALLIDDERLARLELRRLLGAHPEVEIVGEARAADEALPMIAKLAPELLFLDIQMPGMTGFDLLEQLDDVPQVIFTTAYDEYALKAFEVNALDYLLKPVVPARLAAALARVRPRSEPSRLEQVFVRDGERCWIVRLPEIFLLESEGNYTRVHFGGERPLIRRSLNVLEEQLDPAMFFRAGRKEIVNLKWIDKVDITVTGGLRVTLRGGRTVEMSRRQSSRLREILSL